MTLSQWLSERPLRKCLEDIICFFSNTLLRISHFKKHIETNLCNKRTSLLIRSINLKDLFIAGGGGGGSCISTLEWPFLRINLNNSFSIIKRLLVEMRMRASKISMFANLGRKERVKNKIWSFSFLRSLSFHGCQLTHATTYC